MSTLVTRFLLGNFPTDYIQNVLHYFYTVTSLVMPYINQTTYLLVDFQQCDFPKYIPLE